jgi:hypothetical protein
VFTGARRESVRPFKSIGSFHAQVPVFSRSRSGNRHAPFAWSPAERMLQMSGNIAAQLGVAEILQFDCDSHLIAILPNKDCPSTVQFVSEMNMVKFAPSATYSLLRL